ncbi:MAG: tetratricopeptide repeat protein [Caldilineaceae bacterium]|jgi:predicted ATPase/DNA-binding XRE family transcriptional regulator|nr:tetratricopeptide repeat protein [Caldilineaceae bacterium]
MSTHAPSAQLPPLGRLLKRLRAQQDLTQEALAERVHCSVQAIRFFESGRRRPSWEMAELLADALQVPAAEREEFIRMARQAAPHAAPADEPDLSLTPPGPQPALPTLGPATRLPRPLTPLIGRAAECELLETLLIQEQRRLVTLIGTGGIGKTRLALHMAHWLADRFPDGAAFVSLSSLRQSAEMPAAIARVLGATLAGDQDPLQQLGELLERQALLLVLDNFEHLLSGGGDEATDLISHLMRHTAGVQLLVTSTERLRVAAESVVELSGLTATGSSMDATPAEAVMLYVERARQVSPDFALTPANAAAVERICTLLEGLPLGLELAASWARMLTAAEIAAEIERSIDFLALAERGAPHRHRSLRAVFDYTWRLMAAEEQHILPRLAIFRGGFDRIAAFEVAGATLLQLAALIDKSVLRVAEEKQDDGTQRVRYSLHGLLRHFLLEKLEMAGELENIQRAHASYFTGFAEHVHSHLFGKDTAGWQRRLDQEQGNLALALNWTLIEGRDAALGLRLAGALSRFWRLSGEWRQGRAWLELALAQPEQGAVAARARALVGLGACYHALADYGQAERCLDEGLALWRQVGDAQWIAWALFQKGTLYSSQGNLTQAVVDLEASLALYRELPDPWGVATALNQLGAAAIVTGDYARAERCLHESIPLMRSLGQGRTGLAVALNALGRTVLAHGEIARAITLFEEALAIFSQRNMREGRAWSHINLGLAWLQAGELDATQHQLRISLDLYVELEMMTGVTAALNALAAVAAAQARFADAVRLAGAVETLCREHDCHLTQFEENLHAAALSQARHGLTADEFDALHGEGSQLLLAHAVSLGRTIADDQGEERR